MKKKNPNKFMRDSTKELDQEVIRLGRFSAGLRDQ
ncbi:hypothetical protein E2C01_036139 [Portunus trituberculatus]|uniref:Uncharacterized protein n=1 Tax=Portunus trituberculatus TaxID=210409 RepID=A0A5B7FBN6_PORTR|nr:hypothetical protein [Portunus trituberculatus]